MNTIVEAINAAGRAFVDFSLPMLIQSSVLIAILLAVDAVLRRRVRAVFRYWIWMLVLVKLVLPPSLGSPISVGTWLGDKLEVPTASLVEPEPMPVPDLEPQGQEPSPIVSDIVAPSDPMIAQPSVLAPASMPTLPEMQQAVISLNWQGFLLLAWSAVVIALTLLLVQRAFFVRGLVAQAQNANRGLLDELENCCQRLSLRRRIGLRLSPNAASPAVCGLVHPAILIPQSLAPKLHSHDLHAVLLHELAHVKRGDLWINLAQTLLQIVYFYNPLLWLANAMIRRTREQAVDEAVLVAMGETARQYPEILVNIAKLAFTRRPALSLRLIGVVESRSALTARIKHILSRPIPTSARLGILGLLVIVVVAFVVLPMAKARPLTERANEVMVLAAEEARGLHHNYIGTEHILLALTRDPNAVSGKVLEAVGLDGETLKAEVLTHVQPGSGPTPGGRLSATPRVQRVFHYAEQEAMLFGHDYIGTEHILLGLMRQKDGAAAEVLRGGSVTLAQMRAEVLHFVRAGHGVGARDDDARETGGALGDSATPIDRDAGGGAPVEPAKAGAAREMKSSDSSLVARLANGVTVELLGVCEHPSEGKQWWRPDGSEMKESPHHRIDRSVHPYASESAYEIAVRVDGLPEGAGVTMKTEPAGTRTTGTGLDGLRWLATALPKDLEICTVLCGVAAGAWETTAETTGETAKGVGMALGGVSFAPAIENADSEIVIAVTDDITDRPSRVVAATTDGRIVVPSRLLMNSAGKARQTTAYFKDLPLSQIEKFRFQTRPWTWVEFQNVSLRPGQSADGEVRAQVNEDQAKQAQVVLPALDQQAVILDLATGELVPMPPAGPEPAKVQQALRELGKGDILYDVDLGDRSLILLRGAVSEQAQEDTGEPGIKGHSVGDNLPEVLTVTTAEGRRYEVTVLSADEKSCTLKYSPISTAGDSYGNVKFEVPSKLKELGIPAGGKPGRVGGTLEFRVAAKWRSLDSAAIERYQRALVNGDNPREADFAWFPSRVSTTGSSEVFVQEHGGAIYVLLWNKPPHVILASQDWGLDEVHRTTDAMGRLAIGLTLNEKGASLLHDITAANVGRSLAILVEGEVISMPHVMSPLDGRSALITGNFTEREVADMMAALGRGMTVTRRPAGPGETSDAAEKTPFSVHGMVTDPSVRPMAGVEIAASCGVGTLLPTGRTVTDEAGRYTLYFKPGIVGHEGLLQAATISARKPGFYEANLYRQGNLAMAGKPPRPDDIARYAGVVLPDQPYELNFVMRPAARIEGELVDGKGKPLSGQTLWLNGNERYPSTSVLATIQTDEIGRFSVETVPLEATWFESPRPSRVHSDSIDLTTPGTWQVKLEYSSDGAKLTIAQVQPPIASRGDVTLTLGGDDPLGLFYNEHGLWFELDNRSADSVEINPHPLDQDADRQGEWGYVEVLAEDGNAVTYKWRDSPPSVHQIPAGRRYKVQDFLNGMPLRESGPGVYKARLTLRVRNVRTDEATFVSSNWHTFRVTPAGRWPDQLRGPYVELREAEAFAATCNYGHGSHDEAIHCLLSLAEKYAGTKYAMEAYFTAADQANTASNETGDLAYQAKRREYHREIVKRWPDVVNHPTIYARLHTHFGMPEPEFIQSRRETYRWLLSVTEEQKIASIRDYGAFTVRPSDEPTDDNVRRSLAALNQYISQTKQMLETSIPDIATDASKPEIGSEMLTNAVPDVVANASAHVPAGDRAKKRAEGGLAWQRTDRYVPPDPNGFFPDDPEGGKKLDALFRAVDKDRRSHDEILSTVRQGFRRTTQHRTLVLSWIGNRYVWNKDPQNPQAIEIMYHAAPLEQHYAVYFGLSVVRDKTPNILRTLADICMRGEEVGRVTWGLGDQRDTLLPYVTAHLQDSDPDKRQTAELLVKHFKGELDFEQWQREKRDEQARARLGDQLPQIRQTLLTGDSEARRQAFVTLARSGGSVLDDSFLPALQAAASDPSSEVRNDVVRTVGGRWIWSAQQQDPNAIALALRLSSDSDREVRYNAVYYGLSTVRDKSEAVVRRLVEMALAEHENNFYGRIVWGLKGPMQAAPASFTQALAGHLDRSKSDGHFAASVYQLHRDVLGTEPPADWGLAKVRDRYPDDVFVVPFSAREPFKPADSDALWAEFSAALPAGVTAERLTGWYDSRATVCHAKIRGKEQAEAVRTAIENHPRLRAGEITPLTVPTQLFLEERGEPARPRAQVASPQPRAESGTETPTGPGPIQQRIDAAAPGDTVRLEAGTYHERLRIDKPLTLQGAGWDKTTVVMESRIPESREQAADLLGQSVLAVVGARDVTIRGIRFTAPGPRLEGRSLPMAIVSLSQCEARFSDCAVIGGPGDGIHIVDQSNAAFRRCLVAAVWGTGIRVGSKKDTAEARIEDSDIRNCHYAGICISRGNKATIERCRVSGAAWHGIRYDDASPVISGNLIFGSARSGIYASGQTQATIKGNLFYANEMGGMSCWFQDKDLIEGNTFSDNKGPGLAILGASKPSARSNIFYANPAGVSIGDIGDDSPFAKSDGTAALENNLFWANERAIQRTSDTGAAQAVTLDEKAGVAIDPGFAAPDAKDFSLKTDSPARQKGVGAADLIPFASPWPLQPEESAIIPQGDSRDSRQWRDPPLP